ncbi:MAG: YeeE/YedE thiosulfate transporter family protein [Bdellovibrionota bacterium]
MTFTREIAGGILIGVGSALPLLFHARIKGISGLASSMLRPFTEVGREGALFIAGLVLGGFVWKYFGLTHPDLYLTQNTSVTTWALAGLLVGFGTRLGGGCTSGHGICGIGRFSKRSFVATLIFMASAVATVLVGAALS